MHPIYLDFNSTSPLLPEVAAAMAQADAAGYANPASQHAEGRRAHRVLEETREEIARLLGADLTGRQPDRLIFTSGGTEANNLVLLGLASAKRMGSGEWGMGNGGRLIVSAIEHPSVKAVADDLGKRGWQIDTLKVTGDGVVDLDHLDELLTASDFMLESSPMRSFTVAAPKSSIPIAPPLVSVMLANNETGVLQPLAEIVRRCQAAGVPVHTDAVQAIGKIRIDFRALGVAAMTAAPHKFGGPRGIGALILRHGVDLQPILHGATQQLGLRPGTESISLPIGFLAALKVWERNGEKWTSRITELRDRFESGVRQAQPQAVVNGAQAARVPHTSNIAFLGHDRQALFMALDLAGICCSTGSACASGSSEPSPTLLAMNLPREIVESSLRFSLGPTTTADDIDEAVRRIAKAVRT
jgi:cysteine desulfurase